MKLNIIGSSSAGNCYVLQNSDEALVIEAGRDISYTKKAIGYSRSKVVGCLITHRHTDHAKHLKQYLDWNIPVAAPSEVFSRLTDGNQLHLPDRPAMFHMGNFTIHSFPVKHNADCRGYLIEHQDIGRLLFLTDCSSCNYRFKDLTHVMIEANYSFELWDKYPERRHSNFNHMEIGTTVDYLMQQNLTKVNDIILLHLSDGLSNADEFKQTVERATGIPTTVADSGMEMEL